MKRFFFLAIVGTFALSCGNDQLHGGNGGASPDTMNVNIPAPNDNNSGRTGTGTGADSTIRNTGGGHGSVSGNPNGRPTGGTGTTGDSLAHH